MDILLVTSQDSATQAFSNRLASLPRLTCVQTVSTANEAIAKLQRTDADLALFDLDIPELDPLLLVSHLGLADINSPLGFMDSTTDLPTMNQVLKLRKLSYLSKNTSADELDNALEAINRTGQYLPKSLHRSRFQAGGLDRLVRLSEAQREVLNLMRLGLSNGAIASRLGLNEMSVRSYLAGALATLAIADGADLSDNLLKQHA